jgi:hypothetical protein
MKISVKNGLTIHGTLFSFFVSNTVFTILFFRISNFFNLSTTEETWLGIVLVLDHNNTFYKWRQCCYLLYLLELVRSYHAIYTCTPILWFVFPLRLMRLITDRYFCHFIQFIYHFWFHKDRRIDSAMKWWIWDFNKVLILLIDSYKLSSFSPSLKNM